MVTSWILSNVHICPLPPHWNSIFFYSPVTWTLPYLTPQLPTSAFSLTYLSRFPHYLNNAHPQWLLLETSSQLPLYRLPLLHTTHLAPVQHDDLTSYCSPSHDLIFQPQWPSFYCSDMPRPWQELFSLPRSAPLILPNLNMNGFFFFFRSQLKCVCWPLKLKATPSEVITHMYIYT